MSYYYENEKPWLFSDEGQRVLFSAWEKGKYLLGVAGAFNGMMLFAGDGPRAGDTFKMMAILDRLVELKAIREVTTEVRGQDRVFVAHNHAAACL